METNIHNGLILDVWPTTADRIKFKYFPQWKYFNQFISGHGPFRDRIHRFKNNDANPTNANCTCGLGTHSALHVLNECSYSKGLRQTILKLAKVVQGTTCSSAMLKLFHKNPNKFSRINQLLRRLQELSPPDYLDGWQPP